MPNNVKQQPEQSENFKHLEEEALESIRRGVAYDIAYEFEYNSKLRSLDMKEQVIELNNDVARHASDFASGSEQQNEEKEDSYLATVIKRKALEYREGYHSLNTSEKGVVYLGLISILDVRFNSPDCQSKLFTNEEWLGLRKQYRPIIDTTPLSMHYDPVFNPKHADIAFCIFFVLQVLSGIRYNPGLFHTAISSSEWDVVVKFGQVLGHVERARQIEDDTHLTLNVTLSEAALKVDLRVINDKIIQRYNIQHDLAVLEAAAKDSGSAKFMNDRIKISIENKVIIDNYLMDGVLVTSVNSLQVYGLSVHFLNTTLEEPDLYVTKELCNHTISKSLSSIKSYLNLALELLCFRDDCISRNNAQNEHLVKQENQKKNKEKKNSTSTIVKVDPKTRVSQRKMEHTTQQQVPYPISTQKTFGSQDHEAPSPINLVYKACANKAFY